MTSSKALVFITAVFVSSLILAFTGVAGKFESVDIPLHFLGGFGWGMMALILIRKAQVSKPQWFTFLFTIGVVLIVGTVWEFAEYGLELLVPKSEFLTPLALRDTLADLFNDSLGAASAWVLFKNKNS